LEVKNLSKRFGNIQAVNNISFSIPEGSVFGLIGRNGAGKTTTIRMMMNIYIPDQGEVFLRGKQIGYDFRDRVGYLPEERGLFKKMKVWDTLMFFAEIKGKKGIDIRNSADEYLNRFSLSDRKNSKIEDLSKGNQQKVQFIATILHDPDFIVLDEPFAGLDPINTQILKEVILELKNNGKVIIFSTHLMDFAEKMCSHIAMIDRGELILSGNLADIKKKYGEKNIMLKYSGDLNAIRQHPLVDKVNDYGNITGIRLKESGQSQDFLKLLLEKNIIIKAFQAEEISLHEIFIELAGTDGESLIH
jgi:ABC-2 type transport system ATP-binding protein